MGGFMEWRQASNAPDGVAADRRAHGARCTIFNHIGLQRLSIKRHKLLNK
jgi:hypothetical protein